MSEKPRNPNFVYKFSDALQQVLAVSKKTGNVTCEDGVKYSCDEIMLIEGKLTPEAHRIKKLIGGEIVGYRRIENADNFGNAKAGNETKQLEIF